MSIRRRYHTIGTLQTLTDSTNYPKLSWASEHSKRLITKHNLLLNGAKTKYIIFSTTKIKQNILQDSEYSFDLNNNKIEKVSDWKVLGMSFEENLSCEKHIDQLICTCYKKLFLLKKSKYFAPQKTRKHLAEALIILKIDYGNTIHSNASQNSLMRLQKLLKPTCSFVSGRYSN